MSYQLRDQTWMKPGQHWCKLRNQRIRVYPDKCMMCSESEGCEEWAEVLEQLRRRKDLAPKRRSQ